MIFEIEIAPLGMKSLVKVQARTERAETVTSIGSLTGSAVPSHSTAFRTQWPLSDSGICSVTS